MRRRLWIGILTLLLLALLLGGGIVAHYEWVLRPRLLRAAGVLHLSPLTADIPAGSVLPPAPGRANAAPFYVTALNLYNARRLPLLRKRALDPFLPEPPLGAPELRLLLRGAWQQTCDFYTCAPGRAPLVVRHLAGDGRWTCVEATDPFAARPYIAPLRQLAQAALNWGRQRERQRQTVAAQMAFFAVIRLGGHLRQHPGSLLDVELGLEIEQKGLHYLEAFYAAARNAARRRDCRRYRESLARLQTAVRAKFAQMDNPEAAMRVLRSDHDPLWRIEATAALDTTLRFGHPGLLQAWTMRAALRAACHDPDPGVRAAAQRLLL